MNHWSTTFSSLLQHQHDSSIIINSQDILSWRIIWKLSTHYRLPVLMFEEDNSRLNMVFTLSVMMSVHLWSELVLVSRWCSNDTLRWWMTNPDAGEMLARQGSNDFNILILPVWWSVLIHIGGGQGIIQTVQIINQTEIISLVTWIIFLEQWTADLAAIISFPQQHLTHGTPALLFSLATISHQLQMKQMKMMKALQSMMS